MRAQQTSPPSSSSHSQPTSTTSITIVASSAKTLAPFQERDGAMPPSRRGGGGNAGSVRSGGSGISSRSRAPLSARSSATSTVAMHANSYAYLSDRVYDALYAKSAWLGRVQSEEEGQEIEEATLKRLPRDFHPFFAKSYQDTQHGKRKASTKGTENADGAAAVGYTFRLVYGLFSSRAWDKFYLALGLLWSVLCPAYMDGIVPVGRHELGLVLLVMSALVAMPVVSSVLFKVFFPTKLRPCLSQSKHSAGVFFVLATKTIPVVAIRMPGFLHGERRVYPGGAKQNTHDVEAPKASTTLGGENHPSHQNVVNSSPRNSEGPSENETRVLEDMGGGIRSAGDTCAEARGAAGRGTIREEKASRGSNGGKGSVKTPELELPPRHWRCIVCKKVSNLPQDWDGRAGKALHVVIKRKTLDVQAMYGAFRTKPDVPLCSKCQTPFNYSWRNEVVENAPLNFAWNAPASSARVSDSRTDAVSIDGTLGGTDDPAQPLTLAGAKVRGWVRRLVRRGRAMRQGARARGIGGPELWYGREFQRQLKTYFKPELERPSLSKKGGRYAVGARVACFAGKEAWYPGTVEASRENNTYDVRYDNGDIAQHVFPHMVRFEPTHRDSTLVCFFYGLALAAAAMWPLVGSIYFSTSDSDKGDSERDSIVAAPALVLGLAGVAAVAAQFWAIYSANRIAGFCLTARYAVVIALPPASLTLVGCTAFAKASNSLSGGSWVEMLLLPASLFSFTGGSYAYAVAPAYGTAWAAASSPWLLFLLLVSLRLDGATGAASPIFARMRWLGVFCPLWVLMLMVLAGHHVLPLVWNVEGYPDSTRLPPWVWKLAAAISARGRDAGVAAISAIRTRTNARVKIFSFNGSRHDGKDHVRETRGKEKEAEQDGQGGAGKYFADTNSDGSGVGDTQNIVNLAKIRQK